MTLIALTYAAVIRLSLGCHLCWTTSFT